MAYLQVERIETAGVAGIAAADVAAALAVAAIAHLCGDCFRSCAWSGPDGCRLQWLAYGVFCTA